MIPMCARQRLPVIALVAAIALVCATDALAKSTETALLGPPGGADGSAFQGEGKIRVKRTRKAARVTVRVKGLAPRTRYLVVDDASGHTLGELETDRRGRGRAKIRHRDGGKRAGASFSATSLSIYEAGSGACALHFCGDPDDGPAGPEARSGLALYTDAEDAWISVSVAMISIPDFEVETLTVAFSAGYDEDDSGARTHLLTLSRGEEPGLPFGAESVADLAGRAFEIVDANDQVVVGGSLPALDMEGETPGDGALFTTDFFVGEAPYVVFLADEKGDLCSIGEMEDASGTDPDDIVIDPVELPEGRMGLSWYGSLTSDFAAVALTSAPSLGMEWLSVLLAVSSGGEDGEAVLYGITAGESGGPDLPFGLDAVEDLQDRSFEVRDVNGKAVVGGRLPTMEEISGPAVSMGGGAPKPEGEVLPGEAPFALYVADGDGVLTLVGELEVLEAGAGFAAIGR